MLYIPPSIPLVSNKISKKLKDKINQKTKPLGALGILEFIAYRIGSIQQTLSPKIIAPHTIVFASDHGVVKNHKISAYPQEVTAQMVCNFISGGAAINVFCRQHHISLKVVDAGVAADLSAYPEIINAKIDFGTSDYTQKPAMSLSQCHRAFLKGEDLIADIHKKEGNTVIFGEMGVGNTGAASLLVHLVTKIPLEKCVGKGSGLTEKEVYQKIKILKKALEKNGITNDPFQILTRYGGFEIAMICGAILKAASLKMLIIIDGFIISAALLIAHQINKNVLDYCIFSHKSNEYAHRKMLDFIGVKKTLLDLELRLGEGTGAVLAFPLVKSAVLFLNEMSSFQEAGVSEKQT